MIEENRNDNKLEHIIITIVQTLHYMHSIGIAHGDIKPLNILFNSYGQLKISDFGLSIICKKNSNCFLNGGSLGYLAPEILLEKPTSPLLSDIWSLGVTIYHLFLGFLPFSFKNNDDLLYNIINYPLEIPKSIPFPYSIIIKKCLQFKPEKRITINQINELLKNNLNKNIKNYFDFSNKKIKRKKININNYLFIRKKYLTGNIIKI